MNKHSILTTPLFLIALALLLLNDFYLKMTFGNILTGKLSDVAGLFIFPLFFTAFFPKQKRLIFIATALLFVWWKSPLVTPFLEIINAVGIPIGRVVDYTDWWALLILPVAFLYEKQPSIKWKIVPIRLVAAVAIFAFCATSLPPLQQETFEHIDKIYRFKYSKTELVNRVNGLMVSDLKNVGAYSPLSFSSESDLITSQWNGDTLAILLDANKVENTDTINYQLQMKNLKRMVASFIIEGDSIQSSLAFVRIIHLANIHKTNKDYRTKAIEKFEKHVVKNLRKGER